MAKATSSWQGYADRIDPEQIERVRRAARALGWSHTSERRGAAWLPERPLRFAEYLFHAGKVSWKDVLEALRWQRDQRPKAGEIAVALGHLTPDEVRQVLSARARERAFRVPFCEFAARMGLLDEAQRTAILGLQRRGQQRIGAYFVERGLLDAAEIDALSREHRAHNARFHLPRPGAAPTPAAAPRRR